MTNKINGIDVSECEFYNDCECDAYRHEYWEPQDNTKDMCKEHDNCYFKQLARLQQELDIKEKMLDKFMIGSGETLEKLQKENEELKEKVNSYICNANCYKYKESDKYRQALEKIRKEITPVCAYCDNIDGFTTLDDCENVCEKGVIKYLKIIDEALYDRD